MTKQLLLITYRISAQGRADGTFYTKVLKCVLLPINPFEQQFRRHSVSDRLQLNLQSCLKFTHTHTNTYTYIHTLDVSVVKWLSSPACNCSRISAIGSGPSNGLKPNLGGQKGFIYLCQCVYIYQHNTLVFGLPVKSTANVQIQLELWSTGWNDK